MQIVGYNKRIALFHIYCNSSRGFDNACVCVCVCVKFSEYLFWKAEVYKERKILFKSGT